LLTAVVIAGLPIALIHVMQLQNEVRLHRNFHNRLLALEKVVNRPSRQLTECNAHSSDPALTLTTEPVIENLSKPVYVTHAGDGSGRLFVVELGGLVRIAKDGVLLAEPFLNIRDRVGGDVETGLRLVSIAFHPKYVTNKRFFLYYRAPDGRRTIVAEYRVTDNPNAANPNSEHIILDIPQPYPLKSGIAHYGGQLQFGPDGFLYIATGDGGFGAGPGGRALDDPWNNGQRLDTLLGKILRIDVDRESPYGIPSDNPFVGQDRVRPEIFAYGFRNPWRFSFDHCDGSLFVADVGRDLWEEVNLVVKGSNYGWKKMEGAHCFPPGSLCDTTGLQFPITEYGHPVVDPKGGSVIIGGYVYRGRRFPKLTGHYFFADFASTRLWSLTQSGQNQKEWQKLDFLQTGFQIVSFGEGEDGELYLVGFNDGTVHMLTAASGLER
jgi:glucose/arabinose dehydrogenase